MRFDSVNKLILFGGSRILAELIQNLPKFWQEKTVVFSAPRHLKEIVNNSGGKTLEIILRKAGCRYFKSENINKDRNLKKEVIPDALGIAFGAAWRFAPQTIKFFAKNHLLDFMGIDLPRYRGGAHYTWQILHQNKIGAANLQIIRGGKESFHRGEIIKREEYKLPPALNKPIDYFNFMARKEVNFLKKFMKEIKNKKNFIPRKLNEKESSYYPFLFTKINGFIDWSWPGRDIYLFVNAFDDPYAGASTFWNGRKVFLKGCVIKKAEEEYHPFTAGLVIRKNKEGIFAAAVGGLLLFKKIADEKGKNLIPAVKLGDRLFTPGKFLEKARTFGAIYNPQGLKK